MEDNYGYIYRVGDISPITGCVTVEMWDDAGGEQIGEFNVINGHADFYLTSNCVLDLDMISEIHEKMISLPIEYPVTFEFTPTKRSRFH